MNENRIYCKYCSLVNGKKLDKLDGVFLKCEYKMKIFFIFHMKYSLGHIKVVHAIIKWFDCLIEIV